MLSIEPEVDLISLLLHTSLFIVAVPDLPVCLGVLKQRAPLARGGGASFYHFLFCFLRGPSKGPHNLTSTWLHLS
jgi:hypothetical protein